MAKQTRTRPKCKKGHRAVKPRAVRPLDVAKPDNHEARHEAAKLRRKAHEALMAKQAEEKAAREATAALQTEAEEEAETQRALRDAENIHLFTFEPATDAQLGMDVAADLAVDAAREDRVFGR
jgi:DNA-dependent RNA polymerase auxiliary subunit epsilon